MREVCRSLRFIKLRRSLSNCAHGGRGPLQPKLCVVSDRIHVWQIRQHSTASSASVVLIRAQKQNVHEGNVSTKIRRSKLILPQIKTVRSIAILHSSEPSLSQERRRDGERAQSSERSAADLEKNEKNKNKKKKMPRAGGRGDGRANQRARRSCPGWGRSAGFRNRLQLPSQIAACNSRLGMHGSRQERLWVV